MVGLGSRAELLAHTPFPKSPAVLEQRAKDVIQSLGYTDPPADRVYGFSYATDYRRYAQKEEKPPTYRAQQAKGQPPLIYFWCRQSAQYLEAAPEDAVIDMVVSVASPTNPPPNHVGMVGLNLDAQGRLIQFSAVPPQVEETPVPQRPADWTPLLTAAGLDMTRFAPAEPQWMKRRFRPASRKTCTSSPSAISTAMACRIWRSRDGTLARPIGTWAPRSCWANGTFTPTGNWIYIADLVPLTMAAGDFNGDGVDVNEADGAL